VSLANHVILEQNWNMLTIILLKGVNMNGSSVLNWSLFTQTLLGIGGLIGYAVRNQLDELRKICEELRAEKKDIRRTVKALCTYFYQSRWEKLLYLIIMSWPLMTIISKTFD